MRKGQIGLLSTVCGLVIVGAAIWLAFGNGSTKTTVITASHKISTTAKPAPTSDSADKTAGFNKQANSTTEPSSLWVIVNKQHPINPVSYLPSDLRKPGVTLRVPSAAEMQLRDTAASALETLIVAARTAGYNLQVSTAYRGYAYQKTLYDSYVAASGQEAADTFSARPGYSEHQTGWAVDVRTTDNQCALQACFGNLPAGKWLAAHAYQYGFILRYPADKTAVTGYAYEPWHFRYVGTDLSTEMRSQGIETMEEFFAVSGGPSY